MDHEVRTFSSNEALASSASAYVLDCARRAVARSGRFTLAVSGGTSPAAMFQHLASSAMPWDQTVLFQVDERVVALDDRARNLTMVRDAFAGLPVEIHAMPVDAIDLDAAAGRYANELPDSFDLVHLGLGPDGHTASLAPGDDVLEVYDRRVAVTAPYLGHRRMTLTYPTINEARQLLWLVSGDDKRDALKLLLAHDPSIPAGRVAAASSVVMTSVDPRA